MSALSVTSSLGGPSQVKILSKNVITEEVFAEGVKYKKNPFREIVN